MGESGFGWYEWSVFAWFPWVFIYNNMLTGWVRHKANEIAIYTNDSFKNYAKNNLEKFYSAQRILKIFYVAPYRKSWKSHRESMSIAFQNNIYRV